MDPITISVDPVNELSALNDEFWDNELSPVVDDESEEEDEVWDEIEDESWEVDEDALVDCDAELPDPDDEEESEPDDVPLEPVVRILVLVNDWGWNSVAMTLAFLIILDATPAVDPRVVLTIFP